MDDRTEVIPTKVRCPHCKGSGAERVEGRYSWNRMFGVGGVSLPCSVCGGKGVIDSVKVPGERRRNRLEFGAALFVCALVILVSLFVQNLVGTVLFGIALAIGALATFRFLNS